MELYDKFTTHDMDISIDEVILLRDFLNEFIEDRKGIND